MKRTFAAALLGLLACGACEERRARESIYVQFENVDHWFTVSDALGERIRAVNIHENSPQSSPVPPVWAGRLVMADGSGLALRKVHRDDKTLSFNVPALGASFAGTSTRGGWQGQWNEPGKPTVDVTLRLGPEVAPNPGEQFVILPDHRRMHMSCAGQGAPVVLLDYGAGGTAKRDWADLATQMAAAAHTTVCAYDRAGRGLSDPASTPRDAFAVADDIHAMVNNAGFNSPIVLVGHSLGSYHVRAFANGQAIRTAGLVLVDPSGDGQVERFNAKIPKVMEIQKAMFEAQAELDCVRRLVAQPVPPDDPLAQQCGGNDPEAIWATASEIEQMPGASTQQLISSRRSYGDMPLIVLTRTDYEKDMPPDFTAEDKAAMRSVWETMHAEMAALSTRGEQRFIPNAGHYIQRDAPDAVIQAVSDVVAAVRAGPH
jgi:pimeloyl-ACP methyl ester carboxylesterase